MGKTKLKKYFSRQILIFQIEKILRDSDLNQAEFNEKIGVAQAITKWKTNQAPSAESLLAINRVFGISIDQLLTGEEPQPRAAEFASEHYDGPPLAAEEIILLFEVLGKVGEIVIGQHQKLSMRQVFRLAVLVYDHCHREKERPNQHLVEKYLLLAD